MFIALNLISSWFIFTLVLEWQQCFVQLIRFHLAIKKYVESAAEELNCILTDCRVCVCVFPLEYQVPTPGSSEITSWLFAEHMAMAMALEPTSWTCCREASRAMLGLFVLNMGHVGQHVNLIYQVLTAWEGRELLTSLKIAVWKQPPPPRMHWRSPPSFIRELKSWAMGNSGGAPCDLTCRLEIALISNRKYISSRGLSSDPCIQATKS